MEWGSPYVYHGSSEEEMLSETELEEGMYLSDSDEDTSTHVPRPPPPPPPPPPGPFRKNLTTRPPTLEDGSGDDTDDEEQS